MTLPDSPPRRRLQLRRPAPALLLVLAAVLAPAAAPAAGVVAEGIWTVSAPSPQEVPFRMVVTASGARISPAGGETVVISYGDRAALVIDDGARSYLPVPLDLIPPLLAQGFGYNPATLGAAVTGRAGRVLGTDCGEVVVRGSSPALTLTTCRAQEPALSREYARFERALGFPWSEGSAPALFTGVPLRGTVEIEGRSPYRASWELTRLAREERADEDFSVPSGYQINLERLLSVQGGRR